MMKVIVLLAVLLGVACAAPDCATYCNLMMTNCNPSNALLNGHVYYATLQECLDVCPSFPLGGDNDTNINSLGCRIYHAGAPAVANATYHCPHASATGGNLCGTYCQAYCSMGLFGCTVANGWPILGSSDLDNTGASGCNSMCTALYPLGSVSDNTTGNSLACRLYHVQVAVASKNLLHCSHASANGNGQCGDPCPNYCSQLATTCTGSFAQYTTDAACSSYCLNNLVPVLGVYNDTGVDTLGCRIYHNSAVTILGTGHCAHAGPAGDNTCGTWCSVYCDLVQANCYGGNSQYADKATCMTACSTMSTSGNQGDASGDTVQCRIYHAGVAGNPIGNAGTHCPHAGKNGAGVCGGTAPTTTAAATTKSAGVQVAVSVFSVIALIAALLF